LFALYGPCNATEMSWTASTYCSWVCLLCTVHATQLIWHFSSCQLCGILWM